VFATGQTPSTTSVVLGAQGDKVAESRHFPYGGERWRWPEDSTFPTDYRFTGQRWELPLWAGTQIIGFDVLSGDAFIGIGNWRAEGNIYDIFKALFLR
jgi:hypothetical protein